MLDWPAVQEVLPSTRKNTALHFCRRKIIALGKILRMRMRIIIAHYFCANILRENNSLYERWLSLIKSIIGLFPSALKQGQFRTEGEGRTLSGPPAAKVPEPDLSAESTPTGGWCRMKQASIFFLFLLFFLARHVERGTPKRPSMVRCLAVKQPAENAPTRTHVGKS